MELAQFLYLCAVLVQITMLFTAMHWMKEVTKQYQHVWQRLGELERKIELMK